MLTRLASVIGTALSELAEVAMVFAEMMAERLQKPSAARRAKSDVALFFRAGELAQKIAAFKLWLLDGGVPDLAAVQQRWARQAAAKAAAAERRQAAEAAGEATAGEATAGEAAASDDTTAGDLTTIEGITIEGASKHARRKPLTAPELDDLQAAFEAWFVCHTQEEVVGSFRRELVALSRRYGQRQEIAKIELLVDRILTTFDAMDDAVLETAWADKAQEPLAFEAVLKAAHAARTRGSG